ncbi:H-NS histone family protein [Shewanella psychropiezotolerans]|uniref:DNA-binding protein n=1 Tax=Shewanella psychropiezotolerans TaxID=2593655 RepID=A0ABX5WU45_9GAMM|nr:H-NS family nucleoid-associated regulatory protein [Shewanella psychropiezotolerans]QDO82413.1 H-NS histone family protein [Shewanella psychropiezotolerans]
MSEFLATLTHGRKFKAAVKDLPVEELKLIQDKLNNLIDDREAQEAADLEVNAERNAQIDAIRKQMAELGLNVEDLDAIKAPKKKRDPRPVKYKIEVNGETITWTGQGRMPTVFKKELDDGFEMKDFLI